MIKGISIKEVEKVSFVLAREVMEKSESMPAFQTRSPGVLESCLVTPFQKFDKKRVYEGLLEKAAVLFYLMIKNHPFQNGNKRVAVATLLLFLHKNKKWLRVEGQKLYNLSLWVAQSPAGAKKETVSAVKSFLKKNLVDLD